MKHSQASATSIRQRAAAFGEPRPIRRGSLSERLIKCGKSVCACHERPEARHGPYFSLTRQVEGATQSRYLSAEQASRVREQIEEGREFRDAVQAYWEACEQQADADLKTLSSSPATQAEKGGFARRSRRRRRTRSKSS